MTTSIAGGSVPDQWNSHIFPREIIHIV